MILLSMKFAAAVVVAGAVYLTKRYHTVKAAVAAVKAEIAKIEGEVVTEEAVAKAKVLAAVARLKALL